MIPWRLFVLWCAAIPHLTAEHELTAAHAAAYGAAIAAGSKQHADKIRDYTRRLTRLAYPKEE